MTDIEIFKSILNDFFIPGLTGGLVLSFSIYFLSLGIGLAIKILSDSGDNE